jgi:hypothetical protein
MTTEQPTPPEADPPIPEKHPECTACLVGEYHQDCADHSRPCSYRIEVL